MQLATGAGTESASSEMFDLLSFCPRWDLRVDADDVSAGEGFVLGGGGHERLVRLQHDAGTGRVRQPKPGVPEEDGLQRPGLPQTPVCQADLASKTQRRLPVLRGRVVILLNVLFNI